MAERLRPKRTTEKTCTVIAMPAALASQPKMNTTDDSAPSGHGRNSAAAFTSVNRVAIPHPTLHSGDTCPECCKGKEPPERASNSSTHFWAGAAGSDRVRDGAAAM